MPGNVFQQPVYSEPYKTKTHSREKIKRRSEAVENYAQKNLEFRQDGESYSPKNLEYRQDGGVYSPKNLEFRQDGGSYSPKNLEFRQDGGNYLLKNLENRQDGVISPPFFYKNNSLPVDAIHFLEGFKSDQVDGELEESRPSTASNKDDSCGRKLAEVMQELNSLDKWADEQLIGQSTLSSNVDDAKVKLRFIHSLIKITPKRHGFIQGLPRLT